MSVITDDRGVLNNVLAHFGKLKKIGSTFFKPDNKCDKAT